MELTGILGMTQSRVSSHLGVLRQAGLVRDRRQGTSAFYSLAEGTDAVATWTAVRASLPEPPEAAADRFRLEETLRARRERSREFFDRAAGAWDESRSESLGHHAGMFALAGLLPRGMTVLDLGTGTGGLLPLLARYVDRVIAVDASRAMLQRARERVHGETEAGVHFLRGDAERLPLADGAADGVVANMILHHLPRPDAALREVARVLDSSGRGVIVDFEAHEETWLLEEEGHRWPGFDPAQIAGWCVDAGLTVPRFQRVPTPARGRWSRLDVFVARFRRASRPGTRPRRAGNPVREKTQTARGRTARANPQRKEKTT